MKLLSALFVALAHHSFYSSGSTEVLLATISKAIPQDRARQTRATLKTSSNSQI